ncbi:putative gtp cyclohydrolase ii [Diaporthe ampelina]|uniref:Putative gtp cyclohydrolase ii n=1 Tax=Diaporthe ampelina TaxID=1214573 RepID=A0A0G2FFR4_9PEZI|nr:putative gtp cyclohydrolase ii [Diaporthe ampelina]
MASNGVASGPSLEDVISQLRTIQQKQDELLSVVDSMSRGNAQSSAAPGLRPSPVSLFQQQNEHEIEEAAASSAAALAAKSTATPPLRPTDASGSPIGSSSPTQASGFSSRIILTTYPKQTGIKPIPLKWGAPEPTERGPIVVSRYSSTIRRRNAHGGSYSIYYALALASKELKADHRPDFTNTEPAATIGPFPQWGDKKKIVAMDPWGHIAPWLFKDLVEGEDVDIRPTIAITKAHMKVNAVPDGKICKNDSGELAVTKFAVEPAWYLPGVAERFGIDEGTLRRSLFEYTGGSYPELITRGDIKVFLPPIGGLTVYCFGDPANMSDPNKKLALRIHDECNGSDVFGSDICTCRPYRKFVRTRSRHFRHPEEAMIIFGIEEAVKEAQNGGSGVVIYFRKEGRALGEVTKYRKCHRCSVIFPDRLFAFVYNARKRGEDRASDYFKRTENVAGVKDMRFQALMPDILHWLGITKIDRMLSMSNMKHDAIVGQGIPIHERVELPDSWIPADSRVEIDAKITAGYFTTGHRMTADELKTVQGRLWEE